MTTKEVAGALKLTAQLMELHGVNPFKIKSIANASFRLSKSSVDLEGKDLKALEAIEGIGKGIAAKIFELQTQGNLAELNKLLEETPSGVVEMMNIKGIGPKKVAQLWKELGIESVGELLYACDENRLISLKGFGAKTQAEVKKKIEFHQVNKGKFHYAAVEETAEQLVEALKEKYDTESVSLTGSIRRKCEVIEVVDILIATDEEVRLTADLSVEVNIIKCQEESFYKSLFETTATKAHLEQIGTLPTETYFDSEEAIYSHFGLQYIEPELREGRNEVALAKKKALPELIEVSDLKGVLHNHSTYSDGINSLKEMAEYCKELGYEYLGICDHSKSAFYANGLQPDRVRDQHLEIEELNKQLAPFKILKGIESDILNNGDLDYDEAVLQSFDFIVASVHANLKMDKEKATERLLKAIANPYTTILGHPTGRLLLSREGYPIDHKAVIDACAAHNVVVELNAHPYRLDIDWRWIEYCLEKGVKVSINPDAHEKHGYHDMYYGTCVARKGLLTKEMCFNALSLDEITNYLEERKKALV